jgi:UDP-N-acetylglucosamine acyltransferase
MSTDIHATAVVHPGASLGEDVSIGPYAVIEDQVALGDRCRIEAFAQVKSGTTLGRDNHVHPYACIGGPPQDLKYAGEPTTLEIGDRNCIREYVTVNRGTPLGGWVTRVGSDCLLMAYSHVAHDCRLEDGVILANAATLAGHVLIGNHAVIGGLCAVHQFVRIGKHAYVGGMTGVSKDVPPYMLIAGERGWLRGINLVGLKRQGFSDSQLANLKRAYRRIWRSGQRFQDAVEEVGREFGEHPEVMRLVDFIRSSQRGVITTRGTGRD